MNYKNINDYELIYLIRENDDDALDILFNKYKPLVLKIASKYLPSVNGKGIEFDDLIQEGYIALSQAIAMYDVNSNSLLYSYILLCVERHYMTYCRNVNSRKHHLLNNSVRDDVLYENLGISFDYTSNAVKYEQYIRCKNYFDLIDGSIFELRYNGFSYKEICSLLDISYSFLESRMSKIKNILRKKEKLVI